MVNDEFVDMQKFPIFVISASLVGLAINRLANSG